MALRVLATRSRLYRIGTLRRAANVSVLSTTISLPADLRKTFVHLSFRGLRFILNLRNFSVLVPERETGDTNIFVAFTSTETEDPSIIADEGDAFAGITRLRTEIAR